MTKAAVAELKRALETQYNHVYERTLSEVVDKPDGTSRLVFDGLVIEVNSHSNLDLLKPGDDVFICAVIHEQFIKPENVQRIVTLEGELIYIRW